MLGHKIIKKKCKYAINTFKGNMCQFVDFAVSQWLLPVTLLTW